ncbi:hypothetical protein [Oceanobacter kriegii]|nr:hypothetical protein [Oceanobacter kriegii]
MNKNPNKEAKKITRISKDSDKRKKGNTNWAALISEENKESKRG